MSKLKLTVPHVTWGTDPELFLSVGDRIIGSERVIPAAGLRNMNSKVVRDGVQIELHPNCNGSIQYLGQNIAEAFRQLSTHLESHSGVRMNFTQVVDVEPDELAALTESSRQLGCQPSLNWYGIAPLETQGKLVPRSAGGHIHMGLASPIYTQWTNAPAARRDHRRSLIPLLDIFVGNTGVLLDRDARAAERRVYYGRAGEFRLPEHGVEYRTLSNWWLRSFPLMDFMFGMAHLAVSVLNTTLSHGPDDPEGEIADAIDIDQVCKAIQENNFMLAMKNWEVVREFIKKWVPEEEFRLPVYAGNLHAVDTFLANVAIRGMEEVFPVDPVNFWTSKYTPTARGWKEFVTNYASRETI